MTAGSTPCPLWGRLCDKYEPGRILLIAKK